MKCENCDTEHDGSYGRGRFCSSSCAKGFSTKANRKEIGRKISQALIGRELSIEHRKNLAKSWENPDYRTAKRRIPTLINLILVENSTFNSGYIKRRLFKEKIKEYRCEKCKIDSYNDEKINLQIHHINGNNKDQRLINIQILCPNCHSQTDNYGVKKKHLKR